MTELVLSALSQAEITIENGERNETNDHANLKNLDFASSGHTGFQPELTEQQLANIDAVQVKEDAFNKKTTMLDGITDDTTYPTTNAVYGFVSAKVQEELQTYDAYLNDAFKKKEDVANKVTDLSKNSTDEQYPSAKCVYGLIGDIETSLDNIITIQNTLIGGESV